MSPFKNYFEFIQNELTLNNENWEPVKGYLFGRFQA